MINEISKSEENNIGINSLLAKFSKYIFFTKKKYAYYTAVFGDYDLLKKPNMASYKDYEFVCFTDNEKLGEVHKGWKIVYVKDTHRDPRRTAKIFKVFNSYFINGCNYSIWSDGKNRIINDFVPLIESDNWADFKIFRHPQRDCIYDEALVCIIEKKDLREHIEPQLANYIKAAYPKNNGLANGSLIIRKHKADSIDQMMKEWWTEIERHSVRDQLSLMYVAWKNGVDSIFIDRLSTEFIINTGHEQLVFYNDAGIPYFQLKKKRQLIKGIINYLKNLFT
jgi:hypothetical protein